MATMTTTAVQALRPLPATWSRQAEAEAEAEVVGHRSRLQVKKFEMVGWSSDNY